MRAQELKAQEGSTDFLTPEYLAILGPRPRAVPVHPSRGRGGRPAAARVQAAAVPSGAAVRHGHGPVHRQVQVPGAPRPAPRPASPGQGKDGRPRVAQLVAVLDQYSPQQLLEFFEDDAWK